MYKFRINNLDGSFAPYQFNYNQTGYTSMSDYLNLGNGTYSIQIKDNDGCVFDTTAVLDGKQLEESKMINKSLSSLGNVIYALTDTKGRNHIPYRDSKVNIYNIIYILN